MHQRIESRASIRTEGILRAPVGADPAVARVVESNEPQQIRWVDAPIGSVSVEIAAVARRL